MMQAQLLFNTETIRIYRPLTFNHYQAALEVPIDESTGIIPIGINFLGRAIAFLLAESFQKTIFIRSLFVAPDFRRQGLAGSLIKTLENYSHSKEFNKLCIEYVSNRSAAAGLEAFFKAHQWPPPEDTMVLCHMYCTKAKEMMMTPPMNTYHLPKGFEIFLWSEISEQEFLQLQQEHVQHPFYDGFEPRRDDTVAYNSLGLRYNNEIVGWLLTRRRNKSIMLYDNLFVKQKYRKLARAVPLLIESMKLQCRQEWYLPNNGGIWQTEAKNKPMVHFIERYLAPFSKEIKKNRLIYKELKCNYI